MTKKLKIVIVRTGIDHFSITIALDAEHRLTFPSVVWPVSGVFTLPITQLPDGFSIDFISLTNAKNWWWKLLLRINKWLVGDFDDSKPVVGTLEEIYYVDPGPQRVRTVIDRGDDDTS